MVAHLTSKRTALAIGGVSAAGYLGMVAEPPIVGVLSGVFDLTTGLLVLAAAALFVAGTPAHVRTTAPEADAPEFGTPAADTPEVRPRPAP